MNYIKNESVDFSDFNRRKIGKEIQQPNNQNNRSFNTGRAKKMLIPLAAAFLIFIIVCLYFSTKEENPGGNGYDLPVNYKISPGETYKPPFP